MKVWITREQRRSRVAAGQKIALFFLLAVAITLIAVKYHQKINALYHSTLRRSAPGIIQGDIESGQVIKEILSDIGLGRAPLTEQPQNFRGLKSDYPSFKSGWPKDYPYSWFVFRLQARCRDFYNIVYDALELQRPDGLIVRLIRSDFGDTVSEYHLAPDATLPAISAVSVVFTDFADLKSRDALDLIWLDVPFGFVLKPDQVPDAKLAKALKSSQGQGILELPTDRASWEVILRSHKLSKTIITDELNEKNFRRIFGLFPMLQACYFIKSGEMDREAVRLAIGQAEELKLTFFYLNESPDYADSLAYAKGLKIKKPVQVWTEKTETGSFRDILLSRTNALAADFKGLYYVESRSQNVEALGSLLPLLVKLNIVLTPPTRSAESIEQL